MHLTVHHTTLIEKVIKASVIDSGNILGLSTTIVFIGVGFVSIPEIVSIARLVKVYGVVDVLQKRLLEYC